LTKKIALNNHIHDNRKIKKINSLISKKMIKIMKKILNKNSIEIRNSLRCSLTVFKMKVLIKIFNINHKGA
jgi:hypothetical protein